MGRTLPDFGQIGATLATAARNEAKLGLNCGELNRALPKVGLDSDRIEAMSIELLRISAHFGPCPPCRPQFAKFGPEWTNVWRFRRCWHDVEQLGSTPTDAARNARFVPGTTITTATQAWQARPTPRARRKRTSNPLPGIRASASVPCLSLPGSIPQAVGASPPRMAKLLSRFSLRLAPRYLIAAYGCAL